MKVIVSKLGTGSVGATGKAVFSLDGEVVHTEEFNGMIQACDYTREIGDFKYDQVVFESDGPFRARVEK